MLSKIQHKLNLSINTEQRLTDRQSRHVVAKEKGVREGRIGSLGLAALYKLLYKGWINNKALPYSTWTYIQYPVVNHMENNMKKEYV